APTSAVTANGTTMTQGENKPCLPVPQIRADGNPPDAASQLAQGRGTAGGGEGLRTRELADPTRDVVPHLPHLVQRAPCGIRQVPVDVALPREHRARVAAAH